MMLTLPVEEGNELQVFKNMMMMNLQKSIWQEKYVEQHLECFTYLSKLYISFVDEFIDNDNNFIQFIEDHRYILGLTIL